MNQKAARRWPQPPTAPKAYAANSKATNTVRGYRTDWRSFESWCNRSGLTALPAQPETVTLYIAHLAEQHKPATISRHMAAIAKANGHESPASMRHGSVSAVWQGVKRTHGVAQVAKAPVLVEDLRSMMAILRPGLIGIRDRALLLIDLPGRSVARNWSRWILRMRSSLPTAS